jgi:small-conductance mechanosensitive channel
MDDRAGKALIAAVAWTVGVVVVRWLLNRAFSRYERRLSEADAAQAARRRTTYNLLVRIVIAVVVLIGVWNVLSFFPSTAGLGRALLASSAVLGVFAGLALSTPLSNLGSGVLVAFSQPLRLGDRVTVGEHTGFVEDMSLIYTTLVTDDSRRVFVPNTQLTQSPVVNRTIRDPRRSVSAAFPVKLGASIDDACVIVAEAVGAVPGTTGEARVLVGDPTPGLVWLNTVVYAPLNADVAQLGSDVRAAGLRALGKADLLATAP